MTVTKEHYVNNPNSVYSADCSLRASHQVFFKSYEGDYFANGSGEVRVPLKVDSIVVDLPTEYSISGNIQLKYHQSCAVQTATGISASATTGHVKFTNAAVGMDFPRADDCSGNKIAYDLCYDLVKTGTASPTQYRFPIKIYTRDEWNRVKILTDSATITEAKPELTLAPLTPILRNSDGGSCQPAFFDFQIQNNTLYDAPNVYFAAQSSAGTTMVNITDGDNVYPDPIIASDVSIYGGNHLFAKLGTVKAGDIRKVRVYANSTVCTDAFTVYADFGCAFPAALQPDLGTATVKTASASYTALAPTIISRVVSDINVSNLCDNKTVEIEVQNARLTNIYKLMAGFKLPAGTAYVPNTAMIKYSATIGTYTAIAAGDISFPLTDSLVLDLKNSNPFNTVCGLTGSDTAILNTVRLKFDISFDACPSSNIGNMLYKVLGENYCGTIASTRGNIRINYIGSSGTKNNYLLSQATKALKMCALKNQMQTVSDTLFIKNEGGYGTSSGASSGLDEMTVAIPFDVNSFTLTNFTVLSPFSSPVFGTNAQGQMTVKVLIPAGVAIGSTIAMPMTYDITMLKDSVCLLQAPPNICFFAEFSSPLVLECAAKSLACNTLPKSIVGTSISIRSFDCCFGSLGDYVFSDTDHSNSQTAGDTPIEGMKVYLFNDAGKKIDSTLTTINGLYKFDDLFSGTYSVQFVAPVGKAFVTNNTGTDDQDSDAGIDGKTGTYTINGNKIIINPKTNVIEAWSKINGGDNFKQLISSQKKALEKTTYQFTVQYNMELKDTFLVLIADKETARDGRSNAESIHSRIAWRYGPTPPFTPIKMPN